MSGDVFADRGVAFDRRGGGRHAVANGRSILKRRIVPVVPLELIEFPADDLARARRFWETLLEVSLDERREGEGQGLQTHEDRPSLGLHERGRGPGDRFSLPYFRVPDLARALERVVELEGNVVHPGERWAICRDSEGSPFGLATD
jgi:predicted enzyme related to lactoylglutathione lyase